MISPVLAILKKDLKSILTSPVFFLLTGFCCCLWGLFFAFQMFGYVGQSMNLSAANVDSGLNIYHNFIASYIVIVHYVLIFVVAAFSLRFFAEEKKMKTFPILLTSPMTSWQMVFAKWLVGASIIATLLLISAILPLSLLFYVSLPLKLIFLGYFGIFLLLCTYMSAGLLASSVTESLIVCVILTLVLTILLLLMGVGREFTDLLWLQDFFSFISIDRHFSFFKQGFFSLSSVFYILSLSFVFGFMTERVIEFHRWR